MSSITTAQRGIAPRWRDWIIATDPGGYSLRIALRAAISLALSAALLVAIANSLKLPSTVPFVGAQVAMMSSAGVSDPTPSAQRWTFLLALLAGIGSVCLASLVSTSPLLAGAVFCALTFVSVLARKIGPRGMAVGLMGFLAYFSALYVGATTRTIAALVGSVVVGGAVAYVVHFWIVRENQASVRARVLAAFGARMRLLLDDLALDVESGARSKRRWRRIRRAAGSIGELALALDDSTGRAGAVPPSARVREWLARLLHVQLAVDMLAESVHLVASKGASDETRALLARMVRALRQWVAVADVGARDEARRLLAEARCAAGEVAAPPGSVWWRIARAMETLTERRPWTEMPELDPSSTGVSMAAFRPGGGGVAGMHGMSPDLRLAIQATVAVALSIAAGRALSPERWYWAVLAAFVVFIRATTLGETLSRAWQRLFGTVVGVVAGLAVATVIGHRTLPAIAIGLVAVFLAYYLMRISYTGMIACFTIALALLYEEMGRPVPGLMELRVLETLAGAAIGVAVSALLLPSHSETRLRRLAAGVARAAASAISRATTPGVNPSTDQRLYEEVRQVDRALAEMRNALRPLWGPNVPVERSAVTRQGRLAAALAYTIRRFADTPLAERPEQAGLIERIGAQLSANCLALADALEANRSPALVRTEGMVAELDGTPARGPSPGGALLAEVDAMVARLSTVVATEE
ncbi:MAG TPA: FUSC family protein [Gemmatimonadaceae bacterium]|nr:FUSC family protein [Gemmatimonadaceae bacterium]